jgi:uncharacterized damage-inducible protein DinB
MLPAARALIAEIDAETPATRRVLERLPADRLDWQPHPKSLTAGQLAQHIAMIPAGMTRMAQMDAVDMAARRPEYASCASKDALLDTLDTSLTAARDFLSGLTDESASFPWRMTFGDQQIMAMPRIGVVRTLLLNHWYHHRGELVVYLRLLGVPVPAVYGRSADESLFAQA